MFLFQEKKGKKFVKEAVLASRLVASWQCKVCLFEVAYTWYGGWPDYL